MPRFRLSVPFGIDTIEEPLRLTTPQLSAHDIFATAIHPFGASKHEQMRKPGCERHVRFARACEQIIALHQHQSLERPRPHAHPL